MARVTEKLEWLGAATIVLSLLVIAREVRQNTNAVAAQPVLDLNPTANQDFL